MFLHPGKTSKLTHVAGEKITLFKNLSYISLQKDKLTLNISPAGLRERRFFVFSGVLYKS